jgi:hypothetical protein
MIQRPAVALCAERADIPSRRARLYRTAAGGNGNNEGETKQNAEESVIFHG